MKFIREIKDYIKLNRVKNKHIVIYSERRVYYKYFEHLIDNILKNSDEDIIYITSDINDIVFELNESRIKAFYINDLLKIVMQNMSCKIFITTLTELGKHYFVKSNTNKNIEYLYIFHAVVSTTMMYQADGFDNYDTIFAVGSHHNNEIEERECKFNLKHKKIINFGYPLLDKLYNTYEEYKKHNKQQNNNILIAPSWHKDNILDLCIDKMLDNIDSSYNVTVRPHPEYLKRFDKRLNTLKNKYADKKHINFDFNMLSNDSMLNADILITDWSGIAYEYSFASNRPVIFINTPKKVHNLEYDSMNNKPIEVTLRNQIGIEVEIKNIDKINDIINNFFINYRNYEKKIIDLKHKYIYNVGSFGLEGAEYIINKLK